MLLPSHIGQSPTWVSLLRIGEARVPRKPLTKQHTGKSVCLFCCTPIPTGPKIRETSWQKAMRSGWRPLCPFWTCPSPTYSSKASVPSTDLEASWYITQPTLCHPLAIPHARSSSHNALALKLPPAQILPTLLCQFTRSRHQESFSSPVLSMEVVVSCMWLFKLIKVK